MDGLRIVVWWSVELRRKTISFNIMEVILSGERKSSLWLVGKYSQLDWL